MTQPTNHLGQPLGAELPGWTPPPHPPRTPMDGRFCRVEPLHAARHADALFRANSADTEGRQWTYLPYGPFGTLAEYTAWLEPSSQSSDPLFFAIVDRASGEAIGVASYLRITPESGSIEVGHLNFSLALQGTPAATEAMFLMMERAFALGYRRYEWKCNALNNASRRAAERLGFQFEGVFRQAAVVKERNRDTAWFSIIDGEWPRVRAAFQQWLDSDNFDADGQQRVRLSALTAALRA